MNEKRTGSWAGALWLLQALSGLLLILLLGTHMVVNHYVVEGGLRTYQDVVDYLSNPLVVVWEILFLIVVTTHAALGVRSILFDLGPGKRARTVINGIITLLGVLAVVYGVWLTFQIGG